MNKVSYGVRTVHQHGQNRPKHLSLCACDMKLEVWNIQLPNHPRFHLSCLIAIQVRNVSIHNAEHAQCKYDGLEPMKGIVQDGFCSCQSMNDWIASHGRIMKKTPNVQSHKRTKRYNIPPQTRCYGSVPLGMTSSVRSWTDNQFLAPTAMCCWNQDLAVTLIVNGKYALSG